MAGEERHPQHLPAGERTSLLGRVSAHHGNEEGGVSHAHRGVSPSPTVVSHQEGDSAQLRKNVVLLLGELVTRSLESRFGRHPILTAVADRRVPGQL